MKTLTHREVLQILDDCNRAQAHQATAKGYYFDMAYRPDSTFIFSIGFCEVVILDYQSEYYITDDGYGIIFHQTINGEKFEWEIYPLFFKNL